MAFCTHLALDKRKIVIEKKEEDKKITSEYSIEYLMVT